MSHIFENKTILIQYNITEVLQLVIVYQWKTENGMPFDNAKEEYMLIIYSNIESLNSRWQMKFNNLKFLNLENKLDVITFKFEFLSCVLYISTLGVYSTRK